MTYEQCLRSTYFDLESWAIVLAGLVMSIIFWKFGKNVFAIGSFGVGLLLAVFWAYSHYELNCIELLGL